MRRAGAITFLLIFLAGCSTYKELTPKPEVFLAEREYIELKNGEENFTLDKDKLYYIKFPAPNVDNQVLVLRIKNKSVIGSHLTGVFDDGDRPSDRIRDEAASSDTLSVYAIDSRVLTFFWVIDTVRADCHLTMQYRYMPRWRYTFESRSTEFQRVLRENAVERRTYESIGPGFNFDGFDFSKAKGEIDATSRNLSSMREELVKLGALFPPEVVSRNDTAYQTYKTLKAGVDNELQFQQNYASTLRVFELEQTSRGNTAAFLEAAPVFADFLGHGDRYRRSALEKLRELVARRLPEAPPFYENQVRSKNDLKKISLRPPLDPVRKLYAAAGQAVPEELRSLDGFVAQFNLEAGAMQAANGKLAEIDRILQSSPSWASDTLYADLTSRNEEAKGMLLESRLGDFTRQQGYPCAALLAQESAATRAKVNAQSGTFSRAREAASRIRTSAWAEAESQIRELFAAPELDAIPAVRAQKNGIVGHLETELFSRVKRETEQRVDAFISRNEMTADNVPALYRDSVFLPAYRLTFSASGQEVVQQRNKQMDDYLFQAMHIRFPETAIGALYRDFVRNISNRGAEKARAIAEHGRQYQGNDKQIKAYISECDPAIAKWIVKPKEYRKVYAVPVTANPRGTNEYLFRLLLKIPTEAQFPVYDITIKLPPEVAEKAAKQQWYKDITINKKPIKNEGRFRITSPRPENNYESLISPVQMDREGNNILDVRFSYPGFRVFEISAMAQVPIIRKN